jgi:hypothetical protein
MTENESVELSVSPDLAASHGPFAQPQLAIFPKAVGKQISHFFEVRKSPLPWPTKVNMKGGFR